MIGRLLWRWLALRELREAVAADPLRAAELPGVAAACEASGVAWEAAVFGGSMRQRYSASGRDPFASRLDVDDGDS